MQGDLDRRERFSLLTGVLYGLAADAGLIWLGFFVWAIYTTLRRK